MNFKKLLILAAALLPLSSVAQAAPKVVIKSEIASPVILENVQDRNYLKISLQGFPMERQQRSPINLALVIDRSSSMSGDKIEKARDAAIMAVNLLDRNDTLSVITYDSTVEVIVPATKVTNKAALIEKIRRNTQPRGYTALFAGVSKGIDQVGRYLNKEQVNRIILLSDGQANVGPTSTSELAKLARIAARKGIAVSTMGIGQHYNEDLMTTIAGYSDGNHVFVENSSDLELAFAKEFDDVMSVVAQDVEIVIKTANDVTPVRLLGRDGEIRGNTVTVRLNQLYANQEKYVLLEVVPAKGARTQKKPLADVNVSYANMATRKQDAYQEQLTVLYTDSEVKVKEAVVEDVLVDSAIQRMALENERAIELMDKGDMAAAQKVLEQNTQALQSLPVSSSSAVQKVQQSISQNETMKDRMAREDQSVSRKALKEDTFNTRQQNSKTR